ncbi:hypothetical protein ACLOJK_000343 [Asimina triloba]
MRRIIEKPSPLSIIYPFELEYLSILSPSEIGISSSASENPTLATLSKPLLSITPPFSSFRHGHLLCFLSSPTVRVEATADALTPKCWVKGQYLSSGSGSVAKPMEGWARRGSGD